VGFFQHLPHAMTSDVGGEGRLVRRCGEAVKPYCNLFVWCAQLDRGRGASLFPTSPKESLRGRRSRILKETFVFRGFSSYFSIPPWALYRGVVEWDHGGNIRRCPYSFTLLKEVNR